MNGFPNAVKVNIIKWQNFTEFYYAVELCEILPFYDIHCIRKSIHGVSNNYNLYKKRLTTFRMYPVKNADPYAIKFQQTVRKCICKTYNQKKQYRWLATADTDDH